MVLHSIMSIQEYRPPLLPMDQRDLAHQLHPLLLQDLALQLHLQVHFLQNFQRDLQILVHHLDRLDLAHQMLPENPRHP